MADFLNSVGNWFSNNWQTIVKVLAIIVFGVIIIKIVLATVRRQFGKTKMEKTIQSFLLSFLKFVLYLILVVCVISSLGVSVTGLTVVISAASLAITLALQDGAKNLVNGFIIISTKLIKQGDWVQIGSVEGSVVDVRMLYTVLKSADNKRITVPNTTILSSNIVNYNTLKFRRLDIPFSLAYSTDVDLAKKVMKDVIASCDMIYDDPAPMVMLTELGESSITINARVWCGAADYWNVKWYLLDNIFNELKRNKLTIPFNQLEVALVDPDKEQYVRAQNLSVAEKHKSKPSEEDDIISSINKSLHNAQKKEHEKKLLKEKKKAERKVQKESKAKSKANEESVSSDVATPKDGDKGEK